ncbi:MAG: (4Fe-4S)-binding protein [Bacteroidetes bacterium]|nr:(4Fe-4S)-binding protein [Bacteroidota bacterium]
MAINKSYTNNEIEVFWHADLCIHSENCVNSLNAVFNPKQKPWINMQAASTEKIINAVNNCPSGALKYKWSIEMEEEKQNEQSLTNIKVNAGGPYLVKGKVTLIDKDGSETIKEGTIALCRCGASQNKPYCDGNHKDIEFDK